MNSQLEKAIQEAMSELDRIPTTTITTSAPSSVSPLKRPTITTSVSLRTTRTRVTRASSAQQRTKLIKIAPAPPNKTKNLVLCMMDQPR